MVVSKMDEDIEDRHYLCLTCGKIKPEEQFDEDGDWWCSDCDEEGQHQMTYREAPDGYGYIRDDSGSKDCTDQPDTDQSGFRDASDGGENE